MVKRITTPDSRLVRIGRAVRRALLTGVAVLLPVIVTWNILLWLFQFVDGLLGKYANAYLLREFGYQIPGLGLALTLLLILGIGTVVSTTAVAGSMVVWFEGMLSNLPLVRHIYPSVRQITDFFFGKERGVAFRKVVLVEYPSKGIWSIGFVTNEDPAAVAQTLGYAVYAILVPIPPSPITGPTIFVPESHVKYLDITVEEGLKLVMSGGVLVPKLQTHSRQRRKEKTLS